MIVQEKQLSRVRISDELLRFVATQRLAQDHWVHSIAKRFDESLSVDRRLSQDAAKRAPFDLPVQWHHATDRPSAQNHVTSSLTHNGEAEAFQRTDGFGS